jgi:hypothetical protein
VLLLVLVVVLLLVVLMLLLLVLLLVVTPAYRSGRLRCPGPLPGPCFCRTTTLPSRL